MLLHFWDDHAVLDTSRASDPSLQPLQSFLATLSIQLNFIASSAVLQIMTSKVAREESSALLRNPGYHFGSLEDLDWETYHSFRPSYPSQVFEVLSKFLKNTSSQRNKPKGQLAVDVGCGRGTLIPQLVQLFEKVISLDIDKEQLEKGRERFEALGATVEYGVSTAEEIKPLKDGEADLVITGEAIHWFQTEKFVAEAARGLKKGGTLSILYYQPFFLSSIKDLNGILVPLQEWLLEPMLNPFLPDVQNARNLAASSLDLIEFPEGKWEDVIRRQWNEPGEWPFLDRLIDRNTLPDISPSTFFLLTIFISSQTSRATAEVGSRELLPRQIRSNTQGQRSTIHDV